MSTESTYAIVNSSGEIVNIILWDGQSDWTPPPDCQAIQSDAAQIGGTYLNGVFSPAPVTSA